MSMSHDAMPPGCHGAGEATSTPATRIEAIRRGLLETGGTPTSLHNATNTPAPTDGHANAIALMHARDQMGHAGPAPSPSADSGSFCSGTSATGPIYLSPGKHVITVENASTGAAGSPSLVQKTSTLLSQAKRAPGSPASERTTALERMQDANYLRMDPLRAWKESCLLYTSPSPRD